MALMRVRTYGDPVLRKVAEEITEFDQSLEEFTTDMVETMLKEDGIGLAAPQVGASIRMIVVGMPEEEDVEDRKIFVMINPEITEHSEEMDVMEEGCLSLPGLSEEVKRYTELQLRFQDLKGETHEIKTNGLFARVLQHEIDHLDGVMFVDHLSPLKRSLLRGKLKRLQEETAAAAKEA